MSLLLQLKKDVQSLVPAYFALVMATGIIGIAAKAMGFGKIAGILFFVNNVEFVILFVLYLFRLVFYFDDFKGDLISDEKGVGFLTIVAGAGVLGVQYVMLKQQYLMSSVLWIFSLFPGTISLDPDVFKYDAKIVKICQVVEFLLSSFKYQGTLMIIIFLLPLYISIPARRIAR